MVYIVIIMNIEVAGEILEQLEQFKYLGKKITPDGKNKVEINIRIAIAK